MRASQAGTTHSWAALMAAPLVAPPLAAMLAALLAGCGPQSPEEVRAASLARCERQFGKVARDPAKGAALCGCLVDRLAEEGLEITDMLGGDRAKVEELGRSCASSAGVKLPSP